MSVMRRSGAAALASEADPGRRGENATEQNMERFQAAGSRLAPEKRAKQNMEHF
jgi:hypothetical protein